MAQRPALARIRSLVGPRSNNVKTGLQNLARLARVSGRQVLVQFRIVERSRSQTWEVELGKGVRRISTEPGTATLYVVVRGRAWRAIAQGKLSPIEAFIAGDLRVGGDVQLAKDLFLRLADRRSGRAEFC
jgi:putative sterol carrier protein